MNVELCMQLSIVCIWKGNWPPEFVADGGKKMFLLNLIMEKKINNCRNSSCWVLFLKLFRENVFSKG